MRLVIAFAALLVGGYACSSNPNSDDGGTDSSTDTTNDVQGQDAANDVAAPVTVTFTYTPQWTTVTAVTVYGGFGQSTDWTAPFASLTNSGSGTFTGTASLPPGQYLYVFKVTGDDAATNGTKYSRFSLDPADSAFAPCPTQSPTYSAIDPNPCSQLTVPQGAPATLVHIQGVVVSNGAPIANYLVQLDREEKSSHHYFVNRVTTGSDGAYDLVAAPGSYRLQILYPTFLNQTDAQRDPPTTLAALLRDISSAFPIATGTMTVPDAEIAFHAYPTFSPTGSATLPTTFVFNGVASSTPTHLDIYGTGMDGGAPNIGDPWYSSPTTMTGGASFDGGFNTAQATQKSVNLGERYLGASKRTS